MLSGISISRTTGAVGFSKPCCPSVLILTGRRRAGVQIAVEFRDPDNHLLEIYWGLDRIGEDGVVRPPEEWREEFSLQDAIDNPPQGQVTTLRDPKLRK